MEFRLLGAVEVRDGGRPVGLPRRQERLLLAVLLLRANEVLPVDELVDLLWPQDPPARARSALQVYVSRLRKAGVPIEGSRSGYAVRVAPEAVDLGRFRQQTARARALKDPVLRSAALAEALGLWRGEPLGEVTSEPIRARLCAGIEEERTTALEDRIDADLAAGKYEQLVPELARLVAADPLRERLVIAWMTALYRTGRKQEALTAYADLAERLADQYGLDPAPALRRLHLTILRDDPLGPVRSTADPTTPRELPVDVSLLVGRDELLADGVRVLTDRGREEAAVVCLWGAAGVGKSAAATRIGHLVAEAFPDGQLFARLQDVGGAAVPARTLLGRMLRAVGVPPPAVPDSLADRIRLFQERTADRALLVVLDDALDAQKVEQLLPSGPRCAAVVTSRKSLPELKKATHRQVLPLEDATGNDLLVRLIGRSLRDQAAIATVAGACAGLPLALRIIGSRLALSGDDALPAVAGALADDEARLDSMVAGDLAVRTSLHRSLSLAEPRTRELLARLSLVGVTEFPVWVAAPLLDCDEPAGAAAFDQLVDLGLVELAGLEPFRRYKMHALVRSYAAEQLARAGDSAEPMRRYLEAVHRLTALANSAVNHGWTTAAHLRTPPAPVLPDAEEAIEADAIRWFESSWGLVDAAARSALVGGAPELAATIGLLLIGYLGVRELREARNDLLTTIRDVLAETGPLELLVRIELARHTYRVVPPAERRSEGERLRGLAEQTGSLDLQARAELQIAMASVQLADYQHSREHGLAALALIDRPDGPKHLRFFVLRDLMHVAAELKDYDASISWGEEAIGLAPPDSNVQAEARVVLGEVQAEVEQYDAAEAQLTKAVETFSALSNDHGAAQTNSLRAAIAAKQGRLDEARSLLTQPKALYAETASRYLWLRIGLAEADIAMAAGDYAEGRRIRLQLIEEVVASGDKSVEQFIRDQLDNDPRDPANRR
ncbi:DNA-binding SARP family transcriptional activator [Kribbella voronezhensis]|uniref:DNA-binding SARP family transcriptional activator n=1 Tax=Kribbella voronezhensis TaxID=2512212 RepID=A0A4R7T5J8_9ACTN|nr:BTAD domain-containing putative transcriptional regulator [Kribbella voronezhensis]TDU87141.1 DNA-binding SARP family transcriptional activator [Kribbella voronezhensis]